MSSLHVDSDDDPHNESGRLLDDGASSAASASPPSRMAHRSGSHLLGPSTSASHPPNLLLPSSLLPLATLEHQDAQSTSPPSSSLVFSASHLLGDGSNSNGGQTSPTRVDGGWLDSMIAWMAPSPDTRRMEDSAMHSYPSRFGDEDTPPPANHAHAVVYVQPSSSPQSPNSPPPQRSPSGTPIATPYPITKHNTPAVSPDTPTSALAAWLHSATLWVVLFFVLFVFVCTCEYYIDSQVRVQRMSLIETPASDRLTFDYASLISAGESAVERQKELNHQLKVANEREALIHTLNDELANRDEVLVSYRKVVQRLKTLQLEHEESERKVREAAAAQMSVQLDPALFGGPGHEIQLTKYKEKLLRMIFGNKTLEESRRDHDLRAAHEEEIFKLVREEQSGSGRTKGVVGDILGGPSTESKVESVMRVQELGGHFTPDEEGEAESHATESGQAATKTQAPADKLVDSDKNEYILSKPGDSSKKTIDTRLVVDLGIVIVASAIGGLIASAARQPILLGYLLGGSFIGPGGAKMIGQFIQIETLAQFGATFLLFALGVEFSIAKLRKVKHIALLGGGLQLVAIVILVSTFGIYVFDMKVKQAIFVGAVLSMSSTTVVVKSLMERKQIATLCGQVMLGLLIVQDLFLSFMLALLNLAKVPMDRLWEELAWLGLKFTLLGAVVLVCMYLWPVCLRLLDQSKSHDLFLLGLVALCVFLTVVSEKIIASAEVGAFLSGILISSSPGASAELTHRSLRLFGPIRDMFGALFFCSIGMLINPVFLIEKAGTIIMLVLATLILKSLITFITVRLFGYSLEIAVRTGLGLAQVGEFAFVLASDGLSVGLLTKDLYFLLLGTTAVSIFITPFILTTSIAIVKYFKLEDKKAHAQGVVVD